MTDLLQALEDQKQQNEQEVPEITGMLGIPLGGQRRVEVPNRNRYVYVRLRSNQNEVIQAFNDKVAPSYNLPVVLERDGNRYIVVKQDSKRYDNNHNSNSSFLPRHGNTHSFDIESGGGGDIVWVYPRQFMPSLVLPSGSVGADNVIAASYTLRKNDGSWKHVGNTGTASFTPYKPSSPTGAVMGLVYLDEPSGNPYFLINSGSVFSASLTGTSQIAPFIPSIPSPSTQIPLAAIRLVTGTSVLSWDNIYDVRQFIHTVPTGSSGGGSSTGTNYDDTYFRLDAANDPITAPTEIAFTNSLGSWGLTVNTVQASPMRFSHVLTGTGAVEDSSIRMTRSSSVGGAGLNIEGAIIRVSQFLNALDTDTGGLLLYTSQGTERVSLNPSAQGTGTSVMFDTDNLLSTGGSLLLLKNQGTPKTRIDANGYIELGLDKTKESSAGKIGYEFVAPGGYLDIIGAGTANPRWVRIYDRLRVEHAQVESFQNLGLTSSWIYLNATGTAVTPDNAPTITDVTGSHSIMGISPANQSVRFSVESLNNYINANFTPLNGWIAATEVWTRTGNHTFTVPGDLTTKYRKGTKIKYNDGSVDEYGVVGSVSHSAGTTTVTLITTFNYAMGSNPTTRFISYIENPEDFPSSFGFSQGYTGFSVNPTQTVTWSTVGNRIFIGIATVSNGTSNATTFTMSLPVTVNGNVIDFANVRDNGTEKLGVGFAANGTTTLTYYNGVFGTAFTASGSKGGSMALSYLF